MNPRQELILKLIVDEYTHSAEPIGSRYLAGLSALDVSPATIRNDMAELETEGYIRQPHTSAGRIPTEKAYLYYLRHFVEGKSRKEPRQLKEAVSATHDPAANMRAIAKALVELSGEMAIVGFGENASYHAGLANLFGKPDFRDLAILRSLSEMVDRFDDVLAEVYDRVQNDPEVMIGRGNPFGRDMSAILVKYALPDGRMGILGLVGPMRMDYARNLSLVAQAKALLDANE